MKTSYVYRVNEKPLLLVSEMTGTLESGEPHVLSNRKKTLLVKKV